MRSARPLFRREATRSLETTDDFEHALRLPRPPLWLILAALAAASIAVFLGLRLAREGLTVVGQGRVGEGAEPVAVLLLPLAARDRLVLGSSIVIESTTHPDLAPSRGVVSAVEVVSASASADLHPREPREQPTTTDEELVRVEVSWRAGSAFIPGHRVKARIADARSGFSSILDL